VRESASEYVCVGAHLHVNVGVREWIWLSVLESTCESVCLGANIHVNVCVREWMCLNVRETTVLVDQGAGWGPTRFNYGAKTNIN
jgi:hypothetical protein